ncbi:hypothetical protein BH18GEM1_BH18GEM1_18430 [soil metagenome]
MTARGDYQLPPLDVDILIEGDRVTVWTTGEFRRPVKLSPLEALALALGLRILTDDMRAKSGAARREELRALASRLDRGLAATPAEELAARYSLDGGDPSGDGLLALLRDAAAARRPCRLLYLKPAGAFPEERLVHPYALVFGSGRWYLLGWSEEPRDVRAFRVDRIAEARIAEGRFEVPAGFDPEEYVTGSTVYRANDEFEVAVRYSPKIARWILERAGAAGEADGTAVQPDGSVVVRHRVADPSWVLRHVLAYGPDAEVLDPPEIRALVAERLAALGGDGPFLTK